MKQQKSFFKPKKRYVYSIDTAFIVLPLILLPILAQWELHRLYPDFFAQYKSEIVIGDIVYIILARFALLDTALYIFTHTRHPTHLTLIHIVLLYLEITVITILYYAVVYYLFDVFSLFHLNSQFTPENLKTVHDHPFITSFYISTVTFTTLGSGDWIPQTLYSMIAVSSEVILGIVQGGVFVAILIYGHQTRAEVIQKEQVLL